MIGIKDIFALLSRFGLPSQRTKAKRRPVGAALRNPADPFQAQRIEAAAAKRQRKAEKLQRETLESATNNWAHGTGVRGQHLAALPAGNLNPFYIAK